MKAIILAAGLGSRLSSLTLTVPKCLLELHGKSILRHQLDLLAACGVTDVTIVTGFAGKHIQSAVKGRATCVHYPNFVSTNNLLTLHYHRRLLTGDVLLLFSDVLLSRESLKDCIDAKGDFALLIDTSRSLEGTMRIRIERGAVTDIGSHIAAESGDGNFIGIAKCTETGSMLLANELDTMAALSDCNNAYYTAALVRLAARGFNLHPVDLNGRPWIEIDTADEYVSAKSQDFYITH